MKVVGSIASQCRIGSIRVGVLHEGQTIFTDGCGFRDITKAQVPDDETIYSIASVSKTFVVAAFGLLVAEGKVRWTDVVGNYIPEFHPEGDTCVSQKATFNDFLRHSAGISNYTVPISGPNGVLMVSARDFLATANSTPTGDSEGPFYNRTFEYSNIGYALVAMAIERISGMRYADFLRERLLEPLGMTSTVIYESQLTQCDNIALGYICLDDCSWIRQHHEWTSENKTHTLATYGVRSSIKDMLLWCRATINAYHGSPTTLKEGRAILDDHYWKWPSRSDNENVSAFHLGWLKVILPNRMIHWGSSNRTLANDVELDYINSHLLGRSSPKRLSYQAMGTSSDGTATLRIFPQTRSAIVVLSSGINYADASDFAAAVMTQELFNLTPRIGIFSMVQRECQQQWKRSQDMLSDWQQHYDANAVEPPLEQVVGDYFHPGLVVTLRYVESLETLEMVFNSREQTAMPLQYYQRDVYSFAAHSRDAWLRTGWFFEMSDYRAYLLKLCRGDDGTVEELEWNLWQGQSVVRFARR